MPTDVNTYALSIQLAFEAQQAFDTLDNFGQQVIDLEGEVSSAAQKAIQNLGQIASEAAAHLGDIGKHLAEMEARTLKVETNLGEATKELRDQFDTGEEQLKNSKKGFEIAEDMDKLNKDLTKYLMEHIELQEEFLGFTQKVIEAVLEKNKGHEAQNGFLRTDLDLIALINKEADQKVKKLKEAGEEGEKLSLQWKTIWQLVKKADEDTEKFVTTNYRLYGSQMQLLDSARAMSMETGVFQADAIEAYRALADVKTPRESLDKLAKDVGMATRVTGVGIDTWARYTRNLRSAGLTADQISKNIATVAAAQRKLGLSTEDVTRMMNNQRLSGAEQAAYFGKDAPEKFQIAALALAGMGKQMGMSEQASQDLLKAFQSTGVEAESLWSKLGTSVDASLEDKYRALTIGVREFADQIDESLIPAIESGQQLSTAQSEQLDILARELKISRDAALMAIRARKELIGTEQEYLLSLEGSAEAFREELDLQKQLAEANKAFTGAMKELTAIWTSFYQRVLVFITNALTPLIRGLVWLLKGLGYVINKIGEVISCLEQIPVVGEVVTFIKRAVKIVLALGIAFVVVSWAIGSFAAGFGSFGGLMGRMTARVQAFANMILILARAVGEAIVIILSSIGQGLAALGNSVKSVVGPLLAVGLALMMAGIGAYFFAMGVRIVAEMGWVAIPALIGMIIAIGLLGLVLVGLAMLVQGPVALGLIVLAIAIFVVGLAALMMGVGIFMAAQGFQILSTVLTFELIAKFFVLGLAIVALGALAMMAIPGIYALAIGMVVIAVAALITAAAFYLMAAAIKMIGADAIPAIAGAILQGAIKLVAAAALFAAAGVALLIGGILLAAAVLVIAAVAVGLFVAGVALLASGALMAVGAGLLLFAGVAIMIGGVGIMIGGAALYAGLLLLGLSTPMMFGVGIALAIGASLMKAGAVALITTGVMMMIGGVMMFIGSYLLLQAGQLLVQAVLLFIQAGTGYIEGAAQILLGSIMLAGAGVFMVVAGILLSIGGVALVAAGIMLAIGLAFLSDSSNEMLGIGMRIGIGGMMMLAGAQALVTASSLLGDSAGQIDSSLDVLKGLMPKVTEAANAMFPAGLMLRIASLQLVLGCIYISIVGRALQEGVFPLLFGTIILQMAVGMLGSLASVMLTASVQVLIGATILLEAALKLLPAALLMAISGVPLATGIAMILWGVQFLLVAAVLLLVGGVVMAPAANLLLTAMQFLLPAAEMSLSAGLLLLSGSSVLLLASFVLLPAALALAEASMVILYTSVLYLGAMAIILVGSIFLSIAARNIFVAAIQLVVAGVLLPMAALNIMDAMFTLAVAGDMAIYASGGLTFGAIVLSIAAGWMIDSAVMLMIAGNMMRPAAWAIYGGLMVLEFAVFRFSKTIDRVEKVGAAMSLLADSFQALNNTPLKGLREMADEALGAIPDIEKLGSDLTVAASKLDEGVRAFQGPAERLNAILKELTETITAFGQGLNLTDDVGKLADMLDNYANLLENASSRIETAVVTKAMPAIRAAGEAGIEETVRSEAISTVQVMDRTDGEAREAQDESTKILVKVSETLVAIDEKLGEMTAGGKGELSEIVAILQAYLPGMNKGDHGLGSELNSWAR